jgi:hypothetical protein
MVNKKCEQNFDQETLLETGDLEDKEDGSILESYENILWLEIDGSSSQFRTVVGVVDIDGKLA